MRSGVKLHTTFHIIEKMSIGPNKKWRGRLMAVKVSLTQLNTLSSSGIITVCFLIIMTAV